MNLSVTDAAEALQTAGDAGQRMTLLRRYKAIAPYLLIWGTIWLVGYAAMDFDRAWGDRAWIVGSLIGTPLSIWVTVRNFRTQAYGPHRGASKGRKVAVSWFVLFFFFAATGYILAPLSPRQTTTFMSIFWAFAYMMFGVFGGWRLFWIGLVTAVAILFGYAFIQEHYRLWMAVFGGGSLILGGLWLRKA